MSERLKADRDDNAGEANHNADDFLRGDALASISRCHGDQQHEHRRCRIKHPGKAA